MIQKNSPLQPNPISTVLTRLPREITSLTRERTPLRWVPPNVIAAPVCVSAGGVERESFLVQAPGRLDWTVYALAPTIVRTWCAIPPGQNGAHDPRATLSVEARHGDQRCAARVEADSLRWREMSLKLPPTFTGETSITFVAESPSGARIACAGAVLERRRPWADILRAALAAGRLLGARGLVRRAAAAAGQAADDEAYRRWLAAHPRTPAPLPDGGPLITVLTPVFDTDPVWLRNCIHSILQQTYPRWELILADDGSRDPRTLELLRSIAADDPRIVVVTCPSGNGGIVRATNAALAAAHGEFVAFLDHDDELAPDALAAIASAIAARPDVDVLYTDEDKIDPSGVHSQPHFKPDWSPELLMSCMYASHLTVMRRRVVEEAGGLRVGYEGSQDYDLLLRVSERTDRIAHVPRILYHWRTAPLSAASSQLAKPWAVRAGQRALEDTLARRGVRGVVGSAGASGHFRVRYQITDAPRVSAIVTSAAPGAAAGLERWERAIRDTSSGRIVEIMTADRAATVLERASIAAGNYLLFLHADVEPCGDGWLDALLEFAQQPAVGAAGPFLIRGDQTIDHAGIVLGAGGIAGSAFAGEPGTTRGHLSNTLDVRNCGALSGACLLTRRDAFDRAGGFDPRLPPGLAAIDYSLKLREAGLRLVVTPHARLWHARTCGQDVEHDPAAVERLRERWGDRLDRDPFYNPNFDRRTASYRLPDTPIICRQT